MTGSSTIRLDPKVARIPLLRRDSLKEYPEVFDALDGMGAVAIVIDGFQETTALADVISSVAKVVTHGLLDSHLQGESLHWERILSEDWKLIIDRRGEESSVAVRRVSSLIPLDDELDPVTVQKVAVRDAIVALIKWCITFLESQYAWLKSVGGRQQFLDKLARFERLGS